MRVVNTRTLEFEDIWSERDIKYAILSHRWEDEEITYQEMILLSSSSSPSGINSSAISSKIRNKKGFLKLQMACAQALNDGHFYIWCDTCCIDKTSSAELTEAINSMFRWYQSAVVCYAYLSDVTTESMTERVPESFLTSIWFTRGWTLQELIAPKRVVFFDSNWRFLGTKQTLSAVISNITGVDDAILKGEESVFNRSIAQRMSWASNRVTTRIEDTAYCLLGIFDVNMPMLYGEGEKAFSRLQEEIIKQSDDHSIFAWPKTSEDTPGLIASTPKAFAGCRYVRTVPSRKGRSPYSLTNRGLSIKLDATPWSTDTYLVSLYCVDELLYQNQKTESPIEDYRMGMFLRRLNEDDQFARVKHNNQTFIQVESSVWSKSHQSSPSPSLSTDYRPIRPSNSNNNNRPVQRIEINVRQTKRTSDSTDDYLDRIHGFRLLNTFNLLEKDPKTNKDKFKIEASSWNPQHSILSMPSGRFGTVGQIDLSPQDRKIKVIKLGFDFDYNPICFVAGSGGLNEKIHMADRNGKINMGLDSQEAQWTEDEKAQFKSIYQRSCFDQLAWSVVDSFGNAMQLRQHSGLWALKGDRVGGLFVRLRDNGILGSDTEAATTIEIRRGEFMGKLVWDVEVGNLRDGLLRSMRPGKGLWGRNGSSTGTVADNEMDVKVEDGSGRNGSSTGTVADNEMDVKVEDGSGRKKSGFKLF